MECEGLPARLRDICDGTARKKNGEPFTEEERQTIIFRRMSAIQSQSSPQESSEESGEPKPKKKGCGCRRKA